MHQIMVVVTFLLLGLTGNAFGQSLSLDSLLRVHSHEISVESGALSGEGFTLLVEAARDAQFFVIAEEHNVGDLNDFTTLLFKELHRTDGYNYLALEQGSVIASWFGDAKHRGNMEAITELAATYPNAPTFGTDEELKMIAMVGATSTAASNPIWGVDQEMAVLHIFDRLRTLAPNSEAASKVKTLAAEARKYELDRFGEVHYVAQILTPEDLSDLPALFRASPGSEAEYLISALQRTNRIYHNYVMSRKGLPTAYENGREREESMKLRFMEQYRMAQAAGDAMPRVLAKLGHWHILRGFYKANVPTFGNFLSEFSISNGMKSFSLSTYVIESSESWRNTGGVLAAVARSTPFTVIDFRPLRPYAHQGKISDLDESWKRLLFRTDAALIIRGGKTGEYSIVRGDDQQ